MKKLLCLTGILLFTITTYAQNCNLTPESEEHKLRGLAKLEIAKDKADYESVIKEWEMVVKANPNCAEMLYNIALIYDKAENYPQAVYYLNRYKDVAGTADARKEVDNLLVRIKAKNEASKEQTDKNLEKYTGSWELRVTPKQGNEFTSTFHSCEIFISQEGVLKAMVKSSRNYLKTFREKNKNELKNKNDDKWDVQETPDDKYQVVPVRLDGSNIILSFRYFVSAKSRTIDKKGKILAESKLIDDTDTKGEAEFTLHLVSPSRMEGQWFGNQSNNYTSFYFSKTSSMRRAYLGVEVYDISGAKETYPDRTKDLKANEGIYISRFTKISPAKKAGLAVGDIITSFNGVKVKDLSEYDEQFNKFRPGETIQVTVMRGSENKTYDVTLEDYHIYTEYE